MPDKFFTVKAIGELITGENITFGTVVGSFTSPLLAENMPDEQENRPPNYHLVALPELPPCCLTCEHYVEFQNGEYDPECKRFDVDVDENGLCSEFKLPEKE